MKDAKSENDFKRAIILTIVWVIGWVIFGVWQSSQKPQSLSDIGSYIAGIFAPITWFWFYIIYTNQNKMMNDQLTIIRSQFSLQLKELHSMYPIFCLNSKNYGGLIQMESNLEKNYKFTFNIKNMGGDSEIVNIQAVKPLVEVENEDGETKCIVVTVLFGKNESDYTIDLYISGEKFSQLQEIDMIEISKSVMCNMQLRIYYRFPRGTNNDLYECKLVEGRLIFQKSDRVEV
mgnify:CR=1 FL=1